MTGGTGVNESNDEIIINNATKTDTILSIDVRGKGEAAALGFVLVVGSKGPLIIYHRSFTRDPRKVPIAFIKLTYYPEQALAYKTCAIESRRILDF